MKHIRWSAAGLCGFFAVFSGFLVAAEILDAGKNHPEYKASLYREATTTAKTPILLQPGPHLFLDDYLVGKAWNVKRRVQHPQRDPKLSEPILDGKNDLNFQPYMTVLQDPKTKRYRIWYGTYGQDKNPNGSHLATMESEDGIHWIRPPHILEDPAPIQFGCSVLDEGPGFSDPAVRFKYVWWMHDQGYPGGMWLAGSPDGYAWKLLSPHIVLAHNHDINNIFHDTLRNRYVATISVYKPGPTWKGERRVTMQTTSPDLIHWEKPWYILTPDDQSDPPETQFYAMNGHLIRGNLWIGLVKVLHDNWQAKDTPNGSFGIGHTQLAWTRDGKEWFRDQTPFFEPNPTPGVWDHAHAWMDWQLPMGDEVYLYYAGYKNGHKVNRFEERQIGLVRIARDRYVARETDAGGGVLTTPLVLLHGRKMTLNARIRGEIQVRLTDEQGKALPGFDATDCKPIHGDAVALPVEWPQNLDAILEKPIHIEFHLKDAQLYAFDLAN